MARLWSCSMAVGKPVTPGEGRVRSWGARAITPWRSMPEGMEIPEELASRFKFARQKSKLAGVIRGSYYVIKGEY